MTTTSVQPAVPTAEDTRREEAIIRLRKRRDFHRHLLAYVLVNSLFFTIWAIAAVNSGEWFPWPVFPLFGWGIGIAFHALDVYGSGITEDQVRREMERMSH